MHALVIEDQFLIATLIEDELRELGYSSVEIVDRQADAVAAAQRRCPDLITADDRLTEGSGIDAVKQICEHQTIPVIFIVGNPHETKDRVPEAVLIGKPFGGRALATAVEAAIALAGIGPAAAPTSPAH
jgi:DNA-binding response OmpR family regulator